jgi:ribosomal protein S18 acetylase RimI-like enzyme
MAGVTGPPLPGVLADWLEDDGTHVWLVDPDLGDVDEFEDHARAHARGAGPVVLGANADHADAPRRACLESHGFTRTFSMVELHRDVSPVALPRAEEVGLRRARPDDAARMHALGERTWAGRAYVTMPSLERYVGWLGRSDLDWFLIAEHDSVLVGYIAAEVDGDAVTVEDVVVDRDLHRRGIGSRLVAELVTRATAAGRSTLRLVTEGDDPVGARTFYHRLGFVTHREDDRYRRPVIRGSDAHVLPR